MYCVGLLCCCWSYICEYLALALGSCLWLASAEKYAPIGGDSYCAGCLLGCGDSILLECWLLRVAPGAALLNPRGFIYFGRVDFFSSSSITIGIPGTYTSLRKPLKFLFLCELNNFSSSRSITIEGIRLARPG